MFERLLKNWFETKGQTELNLSHVLGAPIECSDERGVYYIEEVFFDEDGELCGWCMDVDGEEFELPGVCISMEDDVKIINWLTNHS